MIRVATIALLLLPVSAAADAVSITADGAQRNVLILMPSGPPKAAVVMFPGGDGMIGIAPNGAIARDGNFLIRTRDRWLAHGFLFAAVDAAPGQAGTKGDRTGPAMRHAIAEIVRVVRQRTTAPIWLLGTSAGAPAALAGAASLPPRTIAGAIVSSPVSVPGPRDMVFDVPLNTIRVPVLIQVHAEDACRLTPPMNAAAIRTALTGAPAAEVQTFTGGDAPHSQACEAFAKHGFVGIEDKVVDAAAAWVRAH